MRLRKLQVTIEWEDGETTGEITNANDTVDNFVQVTIYEGLVLNRDETIELSTPVLADLYAKGEATLVHSDATMTFKTWWEGRD